MTIDINYSNFSDLNQAIVSSILINYFLINIK